MRFFHLSDLHIGKLLNSYNLKDMQIDVLDKTIELIKEYRPDAIIIAGDVYDKSVPSAEAYEIFDDYLTKLSKIEPSIPVLIIAGNHDNAQRLAYAKSFFKMHNIHVSVMPPQTKEEHLEKLTLHDEYGAVNFYLLPFTKPSYVRNLVDGNEPLTYNQAVEYLIKRENIDYSERNVLIAHQFFIAGDSSPEKCDSELAYISVGGVDSVDTKCVENFDYVALGHIHGPQKIGKDYIRYSGTLLKYSVSEERHNKSITMVTLNEKENGASYVLIPVKSFRDVRSVKGTIDEVIKMANDDNKDDYVSITLTDEHLFRPKDILDEYYNNILEVRVDNQRTRKKLEDVEISDTSLTPYEAFTEFYQEMNGQPMSEEEEKVFNEILLKIQEEV